MARVSPDLNSLPMSSGMNNNNNNNNENEDIWEVNLSNTYTKSNTPRLRFLNFQQRYKEYGNAIPEMRNAFYESSVKALQNEHRNAMRMFNKNKKSQRSTRRRRGTMRRRTRKY